MRREAAEPERVGRLLRVVEERRGHALAGTVEEAKIGLAEAPLASIPLDWMGGGERILLSR